MAGSKEDPRARAYSHLESLVLNTRLAIWIAEHLHEACFQEAFVRRVDGNYRFDLDEDLSDAATYALKHARDQVDKLSAAYLAGFDPP